jgi:tRNA-Thr(GGU) m(6)t(6)A37 methyltransferase TsaA
MPGSFELAPIGYVRNERRQVEDDDWERVVSTIELVAPYGADSLHGIESFSHAEVLYVFDRVAPERITIDARHPRNNPAWPKVGIFAQRGKNRPNRLGLATVRVLRREGASLVVARLDAIDGTPVVDIKPVLTEFLPDGPVTQPAWATELMAGYW